MAAPVLWSLEWRCLGTGSVVAISPWIGQFSVTRMDAHSEIFILLFPSWCTDFFPSRYRHTRKRNAGDKRTWSQEQLEQFADAWAT